MSNARPKIVYHYCDVNAFLDIIQTGKLWVSDIFKTNDSMEFKWIKKLVIDYIYELMHRKEPDLYKALRELEEKFTVPKKIHATCFSEKVDSLDLWRSEYAQYGQGLAIGFSMTCLNKLNMEKFYPLRFEKIIYGDDEKATNLAISEAKRIIDCGALEYLQRASINLAQSSIDYALYKEPSFKDENEWRFVFEGMPESEVNLSDKGFRISKPFFRNSNGCIVTYLELDFNEIKEKIIKEIYIGPKSKVTQEDVKTLLAQSGYYNSVKKSPGYNINKPIPIILSKSSYCYIVWVQSSNCVALVFGYFYHTLFIT
jgi:hypothetical protein